MSNIHVPDLHRALFGQAPAWFLLEAVLRLLVLYAIMLISIRLMGRRTSAELSRNEMLAIVALAATIGPPMQAPDRGLLPPLIIGAWVVLYQRVVAAATFHSHRVERLMQGQGATLLEDGTMVQAALRSTGVSRERLLAELRSHSVMHLGQVERAYLEADGSFSVMLREQPTAGLSTLPAWDDALRSEQPEEERSTACAHCGKLYPKPNRPARCGGCGSEAWARAVSAAPAVTAPASS